MQNPIACLEVNDVYIDLFGTQFGVYMGVILSLT